MASCCLSIWLSIYRWVLFVKLMKFNFQEFFVGSFTKYILFYDEPSLSLCLKFEEIIWTVNVFEGTHGFACEIIYCFDFLHPSLS